MAKDKDARKKPASPTGTAKNSTTPAGTPPRPEPDASGSSTANVLVPGALAVVLVGALVWSRSANTVAPEPPAGTPHEVAPAPSAAPSEAAGEPSRAAPPPPPPNDPPRPANAGENVARTPTHPTPSSPDPEQGNYTLQEALGGIPAGTRLVADIETSMGTLSCELWPDRAPNTVANFVGLARGRRPFWDPMQGSWVRRPYYNESVFHRVIPDFMIQGGDILRSGMGGPGYEFADENVANHDEPGLLCMANHGPNTNGGQFFVMEDPRSHLNGSYSVFGKCSPVELVERIARVPRNQQDRPDSPVWIRNVNIHR